MANIAPTSPARRGLAFLAGVGFAAVPTVGPYVALLALATWIHRDSPGAALNLARCLDRYGRTIACVTFRSMNVDAARTGK